MKFGHIADCHLGGWREPKMRELNERYFNKAIDVCIEESVDFVLIAGDLFNTSLPSMDCLKVAVERIKELQDTGIPVYIIAGSHDCSASGRTMIDILDSAGLVKNVARGKIVDGVLKLEFTLDKKTGVKITGLPGKRGGLDREYYKQLSNDHVEAEGGFKIFMFHAAIDELKRQEFEKMEGMSISLLPKKCDYYAGGHVHIIEKSDTEARRNIVYPGPTFPNSFSELEKLRRGNFCVVENGVMRNVPIELCRVECVVIDGCGKSAKEIESTVGERLTDINVKDAVVLLRIFGCLREGKITDIDFKKIAGIVEERGAYFFMKNTTRLTSHEFEEVNVKQGTVEEIEERLIREQGGKIVLFNQEKDNGIIKKLMHVFSAEKMEGEKVSDFEAGLVKSVDAILEKS